MTSRALAVSAALAAAIALTQLAAPAPAHADDAATTTTTTADATVPRVGVIVELTVNLPPGRADAIAGALADALNRELEVDALGGDDVTRLLPPDGLPDECVGTPACIADVAARLNATQLLFLAIVQVGDDTQVDASWVDVATGAGATRPRVTLHADARAGAVFATQAQRYLPDARRREAGGKTIIIEGGDGRRAPGRDRHLTRTTWITGGVAVAAGAATTLLGLSARSLYHRCEREICPQRDLDTLHGRDVLADVGLGVTVAAAVTTVVLYLRSGAAAEAAPAAGPAVGVVPVAGGAVMSLGGTF
ncbi:MAG: hypothetical protein H6709_15605 [Kofleriaceae bacterium]|nr:hypothetical protein [Myxococcales bacterium]MCB9573505.1 hypothetical protein [Kofleriaceae bacterium]